MIRIGKAPFLECSSWGKDTRFAQVYAHPKILNGKSIEDAFNEMKIFDDGDTSLTPHAARIKAKKHKIVNWSECERAVFSWWKDYLTENPHLFKILKQHRGLSDIYGRTGQFSHANVLYLLKNQLDLDL